MRIILATNNPGKVTELCELLSPHSCMPQADLNIPEIEETGLSFVENAILKARHASQASGSWAIADDSGLVVDALNGEPGIYSASYAARANVSENNLEYLLEKMKNVPSEKRQAYFFCALVLMRYPTDPMPVIATGQWAGMLAKQCVGTAGFGYDPLFYIPALQCTAAQLDRDTKNKLSHRAKAISQLREALHAFSTETN